MAQDSNPNQISSLEMLAFFGEIGLKPTLSYVEIGNISFTIDRIMKPEGAIYIDYQGHLLGAVSRADLQRYLDTHTHK